jgi:PPOX class probable F420-dependent enzyme
LSTNPTGMSEEERAAFLDEPGYSLQLATQGTNGYAHLSAMWYVYRGGRLYFNTYAASQKGVNMARDPRVSCMVEAGKWYPELRGVVIQGRVAEVTDPREWEEVSLALITRYPLPSKTMTPEQLLEGVRRNKKRLLYRVDPEHVYSWDHRKQGAAAPRKPGSEGGVGIYRS